jgi:hypothetical protein
VVVISQSANYLLKHGTPYLPQAQAAQVPSACPVRMVTPA